MDQTQSRRTAGVIMAAVGAIAFSGKAIIVKLAYRHDVDAVTLIMYRMLFALPIFLGMVWWATYRNKNGRPPPLSRKDWVGTVWIGFTGYYLSSYLDFAGLQYITASLERLILYVAPTLVILGGWIFLKKKISRLQVVGVVLSYLGISLVFGHELTLKGSNTVLGASLVALSALSFAFYLVGSGELVKRVGSLRLTGIATSIACVFCIVQFLVSRPMSAAIVSEPVIWLSILNAIACTTVPVLLVMMGIERIGASAASQISMIGPVSTIFMGILILGEPFTGWILVGTVLVMSGIFVFVRGRGRA